MSTSEKLIQLVSENPGVEILPIIAMRINDDSYIPHDREAVWGEPEICEILIDKFGYLYYKDACSKSDAAAGKAMCAFCDYSRSCMQCYEMTFEEKLAILNDLPWRKAIIVPTMVAKKEENTYDRKAYSI